MDWHKYFTYDVATGNLVWKNRPRQEFPTERSWRTWNTRYSGHAAGCKSSTKSGKRMTIGLTFHTKFMRAHRIIWEMHHGPILERMEIDHRDGNPFNNKLSNLRLVTSAQNKCNSRLKSHSKSRLKGVMFSHRKTNPWRSTIRLMGGQLKALGNFPTKGLAAVAYAKAALRYHGEYFRV